ncbi:fibrous sheath CABYR-binding protein-like [Schistocerca cancellata]|uniref:fibrous sheath CABYR-binding protein-like n=1 Tax=Schistocerca cancellata TaxID=274614 RepID=UPI002117EC51|nr:fibrous sheath CABYR-binding protein-like [Schistocerca cancellata]
MQNDAATKSPASRIIVLNQLLTGYCSAVESTAVSEEPPSVTAEVTPPAIEPAPTAATSSPAVAEQTPSPAIAEEIPSATAEATPPAVEPVPIAAAPSPTLAVAEPTPLTVIAETTPPPAATKPTSPPEKTEPAPPPSSSGVAEKNRPVTVSKVSSLSHDEVVPNDFGKHDLIKLVDSEVKQTSNHVSGRPKKLPKRNEDFL